MTSPSDPRAVVYFDGQCGLCHRWVRFVLARDRHQNLHFASLQSTYAGRTLERRYVESPETLVTRIDGVERERSDAVLSALGELPGAWRVVARVLALVPRPVRDFVYGWVARHRHRWFGRLDACPIPSPEVRERFLDETP